MLFTFKAKNLDGQTIEGEREAFDRQGLTTILRQEGFIVTTVTESKTKETHWYEHFGLTLGRVSLREKIIFVQNLAAMLEAGLSLARALAVIERQSKNEAFKTITRRISQTVAQGSLLSNAFLERPDIFPPVFAAMVVAGEESGTLPDSLKLIGEQLEKSYDLRRTIRGAMLYPSIIITVIIAIAILMMIFVVPTLTATFADLNVELPLSTRIVIGISNIFATYYLYLLGVVSISVASMVYGSRTDMGRWFLSNSVLRVPTIGTMAREFNSALIMRTMSSLVSAGVGMVESLRITASVINNTEYRQVLIGSMDAIAKGVTLSQVLKAREDLFPPLVGELTAVGEETGELSAMLLKGAIFFEVEVREKTKNISTIIEPALLVVIGIAVGLFALSMIGPMYSLTEAL